MTEYKVRKRKGKKQFYWLYKDPYSGRQKEIASYNKEALDKKVKTKKAELSLGPQSLRSFGSYLEDWLERVQLVGKRPATAERYRLDCEKIKKSAIGKVPLGELDDRRIQGFYNDYFKQTDSANQVKTLHKLIRPCIRYAAIRGDIRTDFMPLVKLPKDSPEKQRQKRLDKEHQALTPEEEAALKPYLFEHALDTRQAHCMLLLMMLFMGPHVGEVLALTWSDVKQIGDLLCIDINKRVRWTRVKQEDGNYKRIPVIGPPKSDFGYRKLAIPDQILPLFLQYRDKQHANYEKLMVPWTDTTLIFGTITGQYKDAENVSKAFKRICKKVGISTAHRPHHLRHTFATRAFEAGLSIKDVQALMGDGSVQVLMNIYTHVSEERKLKNMQKIYMHEDKVLRVLPTPNDEIPGISRVSFKA